MSLAIVHSRAQIGLDAPEVTVEVHITGGLPALSIVGLPETEVKESKDRVRSAIINARFEFPTRRITVNLAPADLPKYGISRYLRNVSRYLRTEGTGAQDVRQNRRIRWLPPKGSLQFDRPVRTFGPSGVAVQGRVVTDKAPDSQAAESSLEHDFLLQLSFDHRVRSICVQPITIRWETEDGCEHSHTPDVAVTYSDEAKERDPSLKTTLFQVKYRQTLRLNWKDLKPGLRGALAWSKMHGFRFLIVSEREIRTQALINIQFLRKYRQSRFPADTSPDGLTQLHVREVLYRMRTATPQVLLDTLASDKSEQAKLLPWIWYLVTCRLIGCDLRSPITMGTPIWSLETELSIRRNVR